MSPDRFILRQLQKYDPQLTVRWNNRLECFQVLRAVDRFAYSRTYVIFNVINDDGSYRPLDQRVLDEIRASDTWVRGQERMKEIEAQNQARADELERDAQREINAVTHDNLKMFRKEAEKLPATNLPKEDMALPTEPESGMYRSRAV